MTDPRHEAELRSEISGVLGRIAYFHTIVGPGPGICPTCRGPATGTLCQRCQATDVALNGLTCDHTFFLAYADGHNPGGRSQSAQTMRQYKSESPPQRSVEDVHLLTNLVTALHDGCMRDAEGGREWDAATFVPSRHSHAGGHPVAGIARNVTRLLADDPARGGPYQITRVLMECGDLDDPRGADARRFTVPDHARSVVDGRRVLLVDDTWVSGTSMQSAAAALKTAGAETITGLCVARWLSWDWPAHVPLLQHVAAAAFDPFSCIAYAGACPRGGS